MRPFEDEVCPELFEISEDGKYIYCVMGIDEKSKMGDLERFTFKGKSKTILKGANMKLPARIVRLLFGDYQQIYLLSPGQTVESVGIKEISTKGDDADE